MAAFLILMIPYHGKAESSAVEQAVDDLVPSSEMRTYAMTMDEASRLALQNNFDIQLAKFDVYISRTRQDEAESIYDTILSAMVGYEDDQSEPTSSIMGTKSLDNDYNIGISRKLPTGTTVSVDMANNRHWTNSSFVTLNPAHDSSLGLTVEQDLGKNFFGIQDRGNIRITQGEIENSEYTSLDKIEQYLADVQKAYWEMALHVERAQIARDMLEQARRLWEHDQAKFRDGLVEKPELIATEANYRTRQSDVMMAESELKTRENVLRFLLNIPDDTAQIAPQDTLGAAEEETLVHPALKAALENRRDFKKAHNELKNRDIKLAMERNNLWPEINLTASLAQNGVSADSFRSAVEQIGSEYNADVAATLSVSFPLENRKAKANLKKADLEKARALVNIKLLERKIAIDIMDQVRSCDVFLEVAANSDIVAELQANKLMEEEKRFRTGRSDTDTLIRFQEDVIEARWKAAQDKYRYATALVELKRREGVLLNAFWQEGL
ncbi:MAG: TolC family protein [Candidatus Omnitrophota bacterium]|nr:TolC family protein [Candidatus Omnitrophota bacterium]